MIQFFLLIGIALLPISRNVGGIKLSDVAFGVTVVFSFLWLMQTLRHVSFTRAMTQAMIATAALFFFLVLATFAGYSKYGIVLDTDGLILLARYTLDWLLFVTIYCIAGRNHQFVARATVALIVPAALLIVLTLPGLSSSFYFGGRFTGFDTESQPNVVAVIITLPATISWVLGLFAFFERDRRGLWLYSLLTTILLFLLWQTQSRSVMIAVLAVFPASLYAVSSLFVQRRLLRRLAITGLATISTTLILAITFFQTTLRIIATVMPRVLPSNAVGDVLQGLTFNDILDLGYTAATSNSTAAESTRLLDTLYFWPLVPENPLGVGVSFLQQFHSYVPAFGIFEGPNTLLDLLLYAGYGGVACAVALLIIVFWHIRKRMGIRAPDIKYNLAAGAAFASLWIAALMLGSPIWDHKFWILLALTVA